PATLSIGRGRKSSSGGHGGAPQGALRLFGLHERPKLRELLAAQLVALAALDAIEQLAHERREIERVERLRDVVDAADVEPARAVAELGARREEDDRDLARPFVDQQLFRNPPAVEARHHHVEEHNVRTLLARELQPARPVARLDHLHPLGLEVDTAEQPDRRLVVDHEHADHEGVPASGSSIANVDPSPSRELTEIFPPMAVTSPRAMNNPRPVPPAPTRASASVPR